ncbi:uncharacterized protein LOC143030955 isoform X2 [Oratosquilla oratoria]|uniref:uncharacterized protein LOC143030955 isoform X2 n=1 Tax=Oratosquilla oratoria TaxID=337810 RepID=UPI003F76924E
MVETGALGDQAWESMADSNERLQYLYTSSELSDLNIFFPGDEDPIKYIASNVKAETMPAVLETLLHYEDAALKKKCKEILNRDPDAVMLPETVSRLSKESLRALLMDETLAFSSEAVPFSGLIAWGKAQLGQQEEEEPSGSALREEIGDDLLKEVRFLDMSCDEFFDNVIDTEVLTHTECIHIQCAIRGTDPSTFPMTMPLHPAWGRRRQCRKEDAALKKKCQEILDRDPDAVMLPETVSRLSKEGLRSLLTDDTLAFSSEVVPFRGLIAWGKAQLGQQEEEEPSGSALREEIGDDLLREVRFLDMSCDEFVDHVVGTDVLTHTECIHILRAIRGADPSTLPRTTPLHPARGERLRPKWRLSRFHFTPDGRRETLKPNLCRLLIPCLSSDRNIRVHRLDAPGAGTLQIKVAGMGGVPVRLASSEGPEFVFAPPAALEGGKRYDVCFTPKTEVVANMASGGSQSVGNVTLSRSRGGLECALYVCESGSSGCE